MFLQNTVHVITRKIEKEIEFKQGNKLIVNGEKASIKIKEWEYDKLHITLKLIAKNKDKAIARKELDFLIYNIVENKNEVRLKNYLLFDDDLEELTSTFKAEYEIYIPANSIVSLTNKFGNVTIENIQATIDADIEYCDLYLSGVKGRLKLYSNIGDITFNNSNIEAKIEAKYTDFNLNNISGNYVFKTSYGKLNTMSALNISKLNIEAINTEILFINKECKGFNIFLENTYGDIQLLNDCYIKNVKAIIENNLDNPSGKDKVFNYNLEGNYPIIKIKSKFGDIILN